MKKCRAQNYFFIHHSASSFPAVRVSPPLPNAPVIRSLTMKITTILFIVCAAALCGCSTYQGGTTDETTVSSGAAQSEPGGADPVMTPGALPNTGPALPP
jgi:hypothetical protein